MKGRPPRAHEQSSPGHRSPRARVRVCACEATGRIVALRHYVPSAVGLPHIPGLSVQLAGPSGAWGPLDHAQSFA